jgi:hypothetical protein
MPRIVPSLTRFGWPDPPHFWPFVDCSKYLLRNGFDAKCKRLQAAVESTAENWELIGL